MSIAGVDLETLSPLDVGSRVVVRMQLPTRELELPGCVRAARATAMTIQFGLLGARDTHAVLEAVRGNEVLWVTEDEWLAEQVPVQMV